MFQFSSPLFHLIIHSASLPSSYLSEMRSFFLFPVFQFHHYNLYSYTHFFLFLQQTTNTRLMTALDRNNKNFCGVTRWKNKKRKGRRRRVLMILKPLSTFQARWDIYGTISLFSSHWIYEIYKLIHHVIFMWYFVKHYYRSTQKVLPSNS